MTFDATALLQLMRSRRSVREYEARAVPRPVVTSLVEAAISAPSASNKQPWRFFIVDEASRLQAMAQAVDARLRDVLAQLPPEVHQQVHDYGRYFVRFAAAPVVIAAAYRPLAVLSHLLRDGSPLAQDIERMEHHSSVVSVSLAVQNLMLYAHAAGLGSSCLAGPLIAADALKSFCGVPAGWDLACLVALGYPAGLPPPPGRKDASSVMRWVCPETPPP